MYYKLKYFYGCHLNNLMFVWQRGRTEGCR